MYTALQSAGRLQASCLVSLESSDRQLVFCKPSFCPKQAQSIHRLCGRRSLPRLISTQAIGFDLGTETGKGEALVSKCSTALQKCTCMSSRQRHVLFPCCVGTDKHADNLTRAASSLLLYQNVLKNRPAQAFLKLLLFLQKGRVQDILEAYGEFYSSLAAGNYLSWQDFLLEEVSL